MVSRSGKRYVWRKPLALSGSAIVAVAALIGLRAGICAAQNQGTATTTTTTTTTTTSNEPAFIKNFHVTGYFQNTSSTWVNSSAQEYNTLSGRLQLRNGIVTGTSGTLNRNSLAAERNLVQVDVNDDFTENDSMFLRAWFDYEPSYPWETGCLNAANQKVDCNADFYNEYGIREVWFKHRLGPLQLFVGKQIVTWGESLAFRVGDQLNPVDTSYTFGFANLEQSRIPLWMLHPILNLPSLGPLSSNFAELVYIPGFDFLYTQVDFPNDSYNGLDNIAGRVSITGEDPGGRFGARLDTRVITSSPAIVNPLSSCSPIVNILSEAPPFALCEVGGPGSPGQASFYAASSNETIPNATWGNSVIGFRLHTLVENAEVTAFYEWNHDLTPVAKLRNDAAHVTEILAPNAIFPGSAGVFDRRADLFYPQWQGVGVTANRPVYLPGSLAQLPFVVRAEVLYKNHDAFNTLAIPGTFNPETGKPFSTAGGSPDGITRSDTLLWLFALDLDQAYTPWLTTTGNLTANYEVVGTEILSYSHFMQGAPGFFERAYNSDVEMLGSIGTSWWWGAVSPNWTTIFDPNGLTFLSFPSIQLTPPWTNKYFMKLELVDVQGTNKVGLDGGVFKGKDMIFAQFQYNFSLL